MANTSVLRFSGKLRQTDTQRFVAKMEAEGYDPKTTRNYWATFRLILNAALAQGYVDSSETKTPTGTQEKTNILSSDGSSENH